MANPQVNGMTQVIIQPDSVVTNPLPIVDDIMNNNDIRMSKNLKIRLAHKGAVEIESEFQSAREIRAVVADASLCTELGISSEFIGKTIQVSVEAEDTPLPLCSSTTGDNDLIEPLSALEQDRVENLSIVRNVPGSIGGETMNDSNYNQLSSMQ